MTIISRTHHFVYIHVPKTGGTSLKLYLEKFCRAGDIYLKRGLHSGEGIAANTVLRKHSTAKDVRDYLGEGEFAGYFRFSVVRNPFERATSIFHFLKFKFRNWPKSEIMDEFDNLEDMVASKFFRQPGPGGIFEPQTSWLTLDGKLAVDFLARLETLEADIAEVFRQLSLGDQILPIERRNVSRAADETDSIITPAAIDAIRLRYSGDFEMLGYSPDPPRKRLAGQEIERGRPRMLD